ncbi:SDR family oxidoreductase [Flavobacterium oreochromis]|uniref:SDR family NAD(P)-dependent oxidoreductase n=1 Tax=Flavobacterium oreochromis TaxID=2906078 RepID=UPI000B4D45D5|nr:SDR family oxidoreductase [Flavobacterium oreochromis]OWP75792.1 oxidoreductase [Flavobacterium oreochromis]
MNFSNQKFTIQEWKTCLKVLSALKEDPFDNPDNKVFSGLIAKIYKTAKKANKSKLLFLNNETDIEIIKETTIAKNALNGTTLYSDENKQEISVSFLRRPKNCYCCNKVYTMSHSFYPRMCFDCATENYDKRFQTIDLSGRKVLLTGGRVKVGFATALKLLRAKATVVLTTRFPALALEQLRQEEDYDNWKDNLIIYGLDLRNLNAINEFLAFYKSKFSSIDILINNAAQTIKYDEKYYASLIAKEHKLLQIGSRETLLIPNSTDVIPNIKKLDFGETSFNDIRLSRFGLPVDEREKNSWNSRLDEIGLPELLEVNLINHIAPYILIKELKSLFLNSEFTERFIVNVTSSEGMFSYTNKTECHPHTNMTKAALNMMTLTSGKDFVNDNIFMTSVDVGWISTGANEALREKQFKAGYIPPLDSVDGASRIMDPIIQGIQGSNYWYGVLLKNYKVTNW